MEIISYISSDSFVLFGRNILDNPRINCLKIWVRLWLFEGKSGANEQQIKMRGDYVLVCKGDKWLIPLACNQVIISFSWRTNLQVDRKILGAKIEILNCLLVVCTRKWSFKIVFRKLNCSTATKAALVKNHITLTPRFRPITLTQTNQRI